MGNRGGSSDRQRIVDEMERRLSTLLQRNQDERSDRGDRKTVDEVFDESTLLTLYKLMTAGHIESVDYPVSTGKEANVFHATTDGGEARAVKIFRVNTATFRSFMTYIHGDPRFRDVGPNRRDVVHAWTKKEQRNLERLHEHGLAVPEPFARRENVLVMEFVGSGAEEPGEEAAEGGPGGTVPAFPRTPAPRLKDLPAEDPTHAYEFVVSFIVDMVEEADLVHGDLSEFNILHRHGAPLEERLTVIDVAQSVVTEHPMAGELLKRDVENLAKYFQRQGVETSEAEAWEAVRSELSDETLVEVDQP